MHGIMNYFILIFENTFINLSNMLEITNPFAWMWIIIGVIIILFNLFNLLEYVYQNHKNKRTKTRPYRILNKGSN